MDKGGQAFPTPGSKYENGIVNHPESGMSLRDYFAGQALVGLMARADEVLYSTTIAQESYMIADAMLIARKD